MHLERFPFQCPAELIQATDQIPPHVENFDLWLDFHETLWQRQGQTTHVRWLPSHVHAEMADDAFEAWAFRWNNAVDRLVTFWNMQRSEQFLHKHHALQRTLHWWSERVRQLSFLLQCC